jgi:hypothetical protein
METLTCAACHWPGMTWDEQRRSYGRMIRSGLTADQAKRRSPLCGRCTSILLRERSGPIEIVEQTTGPRQ